MKTIMLMLCALIVLVCGTAFADTVAVTVPSAPVAAAPVVTGWGPAVVGSVGAFYLKGNYRLLSAGANFGAAYTFDQGANVSSVGIYAGPSSSQVNGVTTTNINLMVYLDLFKTSAGNFGVGLGTNMWQSGEGVKPSVDKTFLALGYHF